MTLDEVIKREKEMSQFCNVPCKKRDEFTCRECHGKHEQIAAWLEELKGYRAHLFSGDMTQAMLKEQYNKAVDDFVNLYKYKTSMENNLVDEIAEYLKIDEPHKEIIKLMIEMLEASGAGCASVKLGKYIIVVTTEDNYESENFKCK